MSLQVCILIFDCTALLFMFWGLDCIIVLAPRVVREEQKGGGGSEFKVEENIRSWTPHRICFSCPVGNAAMISLRRGPLVWSVVGNFVRRFPMYWGSIVCEEIPVRLCRKTTVWCCTMEKSYHSNQNVYETNSPEFEAGNAYSSRKIIWTRD